jgi:NifB/MoaA-like Fe-S oxidoreductase
VPVGLSKYREGLYPLEVFEKEDAAAVLDMIHHWQEVCFQTFGRHFIHASDEWYLLADRELPGEESYDGYLQLENGVGMLRLLIDEFTAGLAGLSVKNVRAGAVSIATGTLAAPFIRKMAAMVMALFPERTVRVFAINNEFFGENITVSGLLTGRDIIAQLKGKELGERLLLPCNLLRSGEDVFLDDVTLDEVKGTLQVAVDIVESNGQHLLECLLK